MMLNDVTARGGAHKRRMRVGRGESSGKGKTSGRGNKGSQSRAGGGVRPLTEGGQMPLFRRLPKRGFSNVQFRTRFEIVNVGELNDRFGDGDTVNAEVLCQRRLVRTDAAPVRILGDGALERKLTVEAHSFSQKARELIEKAGGTVKLIERKTAAEKAAAKRCSHKGKRSDAGVKKKAGGNEADEAAGTSQTPE